jgi:AbiV family abortive infection protein
MNAAARNAARLVSDAEILLGAKRYPSAAALAVLAIEESGKLPSSIASAFHG